MAAPQRLDRHIEHGQMVGHEEGIELRRLQRLREALQMSKVEVRIWQAAGITPRGGVDADGPHEGAKAELSCFAHDYGSGSGSLSPRAHSYPHHIVHYLIDALEPTASERCRRRRWSGLIITPARRQWRATE